MSRSKKVRSSGNADVVVVRQRSESDVEGRLRKKAKKHKGLKSGARNSTGSKAQQVSGKAPRDPRLGSKKKIPLIVEAKAVTSKAQRLLNAEQELALIEQDAQFNVLLARLDEGEKLGAGLQKYVDEKLDRIEVLMKELGLDTEDDFDDVDDDEEDNDFDENEIDLVVKSVKSVKKPRGDDELLSDFEDLNLDEWKG